MNMSTHNPCKSSLMSKINWHNARSTPSISSRKLLQRWHHLPRSENRPYQTFRQNQSTHCSQYPTKPREKKILAPRLLLRILRQPPQNLQRLHLPPNRYKTMIMKEPAHRINTNAPLRQLPSYLRNKPHSLKTAMHIQSNHPAWKCILQIVSGGRFEGSDYGETFGFVECHLCEERWWDRGGRIGWRGGNGDEYER